MADKHTDIFREPTRLVLTEKGSTYFLARKSKLQRFRLLDNREEYGLQLSDYAPLTLQKLISSGMISKLQFPVDDGVAKRQTVIDYARLIVHGVLFRHAARKATGILASSGLAADWNRNNPRLAITEHGIGIPGPQLERILSARAKDVERLKTLMVTSVRAGLRNRFKAERTPLGGALGNEDDHNATNSLAQRLVDAMEPHLWFILVVHDGQAGARELFRSLSNELVSMLAQSSVADYLALMMVELMVHMQHRNAETKPSRSEDSAGLPELYVLTQVTEFERGDRKEKRVSTRIHFMLSTGDTRFDALKHDLDEVAGDDGRRRRSIKQFYKAAGSGETDLSLYYMSFLEDACSRLGLAFDGFARGERDGGLVNLILTL